MSRFKNAAIHSAFRTWAAKHKPKNHLRKELAPYAERIQTLEEELRKEREAHSYTKTVLEAKLKDASESGRRKAENEKLLRVDHLIRMAARRLGQKELSRGWSTWVWAHEETRRRQMVAIQRFRKHGQWKAFRTWRIRCPPSPNVSPEDLAALQRALESEMSSHERTRHLVGRLREDQLEMIAQIEASQRIQKEQRTLATVLEYFIKEQRIVMGEAMSAPGLAECRKLLYHESLRHVPTAATHGRGGHSDGKENSAASLERDMSHASFMTSIGGDPLRSSMGGFPRGTEPPARLRASNEKEMLSRLQKVMKMPKGPPPSTRQVAHAWSSSLRG